MFSQREETKLSKKLMKNNSTKTSQKQTKAGKSFKTLSKLTTVVVIVRKMWFFIETMKNISSLAKLSNKISGETQMKQELFLMFLRRARRKT